MLDRDVGENPPISATVRLKDLTPLVPTASKLESTPHENFTERSATLARIGKACASYVPGAYAAIP